MDKHILIVEDSPTQALLLARVLENAGYRVHAAPDGRAALSHLSANTPQLVISDVTMPGMDGYQLCRAIRADKSLEDLPVLLLTSLADEEKVLTGLEAGADAFISKPFDSARLLARIGDLLQVKAQPGNAGTDDDATVLFASKKYRILADRSRILRYLISTYDNALQINVRLAKTQEDLRNLNSILEEKVRARTAALSQEVERRRNAQNRVQVTNRFLEIANRNSDKRTVIHDFLSEVMDFTGCSFVDIHLRDSGNAEPSDIHSPLIARIPIRLGEETFGHVLIADKKRTSLDPEVVQVLEAASTQLAATFTRIHAEQTLRESEEKYRNFFEDDLAGALILTPQGLITSCNPAFARMFGFPDATHAVGSAFGAFHEQQDGWDGFCARLKRKGRITSREIEFRRQDGNSVFVIESAVGKFAATGEMVEVRMYLVDITEKKSLEQQLFQSQKMEAIGRLAGGVAHDFNNILQVIQGFADHCLNKTPDADPRHNWLKQIRIATQKAAELIKSLLAFSRKQEQHKVVMNLGTVLQEIGPMLRQLCGTSVRVAIECEQGLGDIESDRTQVDQVLMNLAANARDAMPEGGTLAFTVSNVELPPGAAGPGMEEMKPGEYVLLSVRDTGKGMDQQTLQHMFEPFFTTKERGKGTGLGLATVYGVVTQAGGHISCASTPGKGTEFRIHLPRRERQ
jgi:PAS domain S-box-containing protein